MYEDLPDEEGRSPDKPVTGQGWGKSASAGATMFAPTSLTKKQQAAKAPAPAPPPAPPPEPVPPPPTVTHLQPAAIPRKTAIKPVLSAAAVKQLQTVAHAHVHAPAPASVPSPAPSPAPASAGSSGGPVVTRYVTPKVDDEYEPGRPNDYEDYCRARLAAIEREERRKELSRLAWEEEQRPPSPPPPPPAPAPAINLNVSGEEAWARRARLSQRAASPPAPAAEFAPPPSWEATGKAAEMGMGDSFASRMMQKMGWKEGMGLGAQGQGMSSALQVQKSGARSGVIIGEEQRKGPKKSRFGPPTPTQSRVVMLMNMVGPGEIDDALQIETEEECSKYGIVERSLLTELKGANVHPDEAVRIYIKFTTFEAASAAVLDLDKRFFGGRTVRAQYYDEARFDRNDV